MSRVDDKGFLRLVRETTESAHSFWWPSAELRCRPVTEMARALEIVEKMRDPRGHLAAEMTQALGDLTKILDPAFWDSYFRAYDRLVSFCPAYRELLALAHGHLPLVGNILDLGAGTGNFSLALAGWAPARSFTLIDQSPGGLALGAAKFRALRGERGVPARVQRSLLAPEPFPQADGAVMNNVLYSIPRVPDKLALLARVRDALTRDAAFFLNDPLPTAGDPAHYRETFLHVVAGAVAQQSPMTEFDLAVLTAANVQLTRAEGAPDQSTFLGPGEMEGLCGEAGFTLLATRPTYAGISRAYFLIRKD